MPPFLSTCKSVGSIVVRKNWKRHVIEPASSYRQLQNCHQTRRLGCTANRIHQESDVSSRIVCAWSQLRLQSLLYLSYLHHRSSLNNPKLHSQGFIVRENRRPCHIASVNAPSVHRPSDANEDLRILRGSLHGGGAVQTRRFLGCGDGEDGGALSKVYEERRVLG